QGTSIANISSCHRCSCRDTNEINPVNRGLTGEDLPVSKISQGACSRGSYPSGHMAIRNDPRTQKFTGKLAAIDKHQDLKTWQGQDLFFQIKVLSRFDN
ncbi:MAG: hypothetical protein OR994_07995, partial [Candidatus Poseidoniales archaeon]|nr:hypothetical protein [Candidatus Poseidoniales archaeon]